jgi:hypothetical protein
MRATRDVNAMQLRMRRLPVAAGRKHNRHRKAKLGSLLKIYL